MGRLCSILVLSPKFVQESIILSQRRLLNPSLAIYMSSSTSSLLSPNVFSLPRISLHLQRYAKSYLKRKRRTSANTPQAFLGAFFSYYLIKIVPFWGLSLISTSVLFLSPLIYKTNKELIDGQLAHASEILNQQTKQVKELASHHATIAANTTKQYASDYSAKAQDLVGSARARSSSPTTVKKENVPAYKSEDFPAAPKEEFKAPPVGATANALRGDAEPLIAT